MKTRVTLPLFLLAVGLGLGAVPAAQAQMGPWSTIAPDGRVSTYNFTCIGNAYDYAHVIMHTSAGRKVFSWTQACKSSVGVASVLTNPATVFPTLLDSDGLVLRIDAIGYHRYNSTSAHIWPYIISTNGDSIDQVIHAGNLPEQTDDSKEPVSQMRLYVYVSPPVP